MDGNKLSDVITCKRIQIKKSLSNKPSAYTFLGVVEVFAVKKEATRVGIINNNNPDETSSMARS